MVNNFIWSSWIKPIGTSCHWISGTTSWIKSKLTFRWPDSVVPKKPSTSLKCCCWWKAEHQHSEDVDQVPVCWWRKQWLGGLPLPRAPGSTGGWHQGGGSARSPMAASSSDNRTAHGWDPRAPTAVIYPIHGQDQPTVIWNEQSFCH